MKFKYFHWKPIDMSDRILNFEETPEIKEYGYKVVICPICENKTLDSYWICEECGWVYDDHTSPNRKSSANNNATIKKYRKEYLRWKKKCLKKKTT